MRLVIDVPEWATERHIYVFAGMELFAALPHGEKKLRVKTVRCSWCGKCCDPCEHLTQIGDVSECDLGIDRPFRCCSGDPCASTQVPEECSIRFDEVDVE